MEEERKVKVFFLRIISQFKRKRIPAPFKVTPDLSKAHWQPGNLKLAMRVLQLKVPLDFKYSVV
jgi:hypothetical protein